MEKTGTEEMRGTPETREKNDSIQITLREYYRSFKELETSLDTAKLWSSTMVRAISRYRYIYEQLDRIEAHIQADAAKDEKRKRDEVLDKVFKCVIDLAQPSFVLHTLSVIGQVYDLIIALEKLKTGRWERAGIPEEMRVKADVMELKYAGQAIEIYKGLYDVFIRNAGNKPINCLDTDMVKAASKAIQSLKCDMDRLLELYNAAYKYAADYEHKYGLDSLKN